MNFLRAAELIFIILAVAILITQIIWPMLRGTRIFPILRREGRLEKELVAKRQQDLENDLQRKLGQK